MLNLETFDQVELKIPFKPLIQAEVTDTKLLKLHGSESNLAEPTKGGIASHLQLPDYEQLKERSMSAPNLLDTDDTDHPEGKTDTTEMKEEGVMDDSTAGNTEVEESEKELTEEKRDEDDITEKAKDEVSQAIEMVTEEDKIPSEDEIKMTKHVAIVESQDAERSREAKVWRQIDLLDDDIRTQAEQLDVLHAKVSNISRLLNKSSLVPVVTYQDTESPAVAILVKEEIDSDDDDSSIGGVEKVFLLDDGRLKHDVVLESFNLITLDIILDGVPVTVGSNIDGYIPLRFQPGQKVNISGKQRNMETTVL